QPRPAPDRRRAQRSRIRARVFSACAHNGVSPHPREREPTEPPIPRAAEPPRNRSLTPNEGIRLIRVHMRTKFPHALATAFAVGAFAAGFPAAAQRQPVARHDDVVYEATISYLQSAMSHGALTSVALVDAYLARVA